MRILLKEGSAIVQRYPYESKRAGTAVARVN